MKRKDIIIINLIAILINIFIIYKFNNIDTDKYKEPAIIPHPCIYVDGQDICQWDEEHTLDMICDIDMHPNTRFIWSRDQQNMDSSMVLIYHSTSGIEYVFREYYPDWTMWKQHICVRVLDYFD